MPRTPKDWKCPCSYCTKLRASLARANTRIAAALAKAAALEGKDARKPA